MDWSRSYSSEWRVYRVNRATWADAEQIANVKSVGVTRTADGQLLESGSMDITGDFETDYYRIVMTAIQGNDIERVDVATLLFDVNGGTVNYHALHQNADGFSVLYPASKQIITTGSYAPAGVDGAEYAGDLLRTAVNAPVLVEGSFTLNDNVVHEIGASVLQAVWAVLNAGEFVIQIDGRGVVHIVPMPTEPSLILDNSRIRLLSNGINYTQDISEIPNRYIVIDGNKKVIVINDDQTSIVSSVQRGFYVDVIDQSPTPINGETMTAYAERKLRLLSVLEDARSYKREYAPGVNLYSIVRASIDGLEGDLRVTNQTLTCSHGVHVEEKTNREIQLW